MFYAMIGIPLGALYRHEIVSICNLLHPFTGLVMFQSIGERVNRLSRYVEKTRRVHWSLLTLIIQFMELNGIFIAALLYRPLRSH